MKIENSSSIYKILTKLEIIFDSVPKHK